VGAWKSLSVFGVKTKKRGHKKKKKKKQQGRLGGCRFVLTIRCSGDWVPKGGGLESKKTTLRVQKTWGGGGNPLTSQKTTLGPIREGRGEKKKQQCKGVSGGKGTSLSKNRSLRGEKNHGFWTKKKNNLEEGEPFHTRGFPEAQKGVLGGKTHKLNGKPGSKCSGRKWKKSSRLAKKNLFLPNSWRSKLRDWGGFSGPKNKNKSDCGTGTTQVFFRNALGLFPIKTKKTGALRLVWETG